LCAIAISTQSRRSWFEALACLDFRRYVLKRKEIFADPAAAVATPAAQHWTAWMQYLLQGLFVPGVVLVAFSLAIAHMLPVADPAGPDREAVLSQQLLQAQQVQANWRDNPGVVMLERSLEQEHAIRTSVRSGQMAIAAMVPVSVMMLTGLAPLIWADVAMRRLIAAKVRAAAAYALATHLFWVNASNMLFVGFVECIVIQKPSYAFGIGLEFLYILFLLLLLGGAGYLVSRDLRQALGLAPLSGKRAYLAGDKIKWTVYFVHLFSMAVVFALAAAYA
jgi:hypothetical protein